MPALSSTMTGEFGLCPFVCAPLLLRACPFSETTHAAQLSPPLQRRGQGGVLAEGGGRPSDQGRGEEEALELTRVSGTSPWTARCVPTRFTGLRVNFAFLIVCVFDDEWASMMRFTGCWSWMSVHACIGLPWTQRLSLMARKRQCGKVAGSCKCKMSPTLDCLQLSVLRLDVEP